MANLKRYRMQIVDGLIQPRHDAGTGEWYAASEVDEEMKIKGAMLKRAVEGLKDVVNCSMTKNPFAVAQSALQDIEESK